jgi:spermidine/putrescine-binding protein
MSNYPDNNPKTLVGSSKVPLHLVPPSAAHFLALALADGGKKYGPYNWRDSAISVSTYKAAAQRHWDAFWDGEDNATDSGVHHLAHAMACSALLLDAMTIGKLVDDRPTKGAAARLQAEFANKDKEVTPNAERVTRAAAKPSQQFTGEDVRVLGPELAAAWRGAYGIPTNCS